MIRSAARRGGGSCRAAATRPVRLPLGIAVDARRCFVEKQHARRTGQSTRDSEIELLHAKRRVVPLLQRGGRRVHWLRARRPRSAPMADSRPISMFSRAGGGGRNSCCGNKSNIGAENVRHQKKILYLQPARLRRA